MKKRCCFILFILFLPLAALTAYADEGAALLESRVWEQAAVLYTRNTSGTDVQVRIASENIDGVAVDGQDETLPMTTWLLLDNSLSIKQPDRERAKELLIDLVSARSSNEAFTLCTFAEHLNPILTESQDYSELKQAIEHIQHYDQETYLTDCLDELLALETERTDARYVRIVVISDGVDNNPGGITRAELEKELEKYNLPVYSVGCTGNAQELKEMYAISRQTGAGYWALSEAENYDITHAMSNEEIPMRITVPIPASLCDGTTKGVQMTFADGTVLQTQLDMPFGAIISAPPEPAPDPEPEPIPTPPPVVEPEEEPTAADWMRAHWLLIVLLALAIAALAAGGYLFLQRKKTKDGAIPEKESTPAQPMKSNPPPGSIILGREEASDITIEDPSISKKHCAIAVSGDDITVYDLDSLNGTRVDGVKLERGGCRKARNRSLLTLANMEFEMEICTEERDAAPDPVATIYTNPEEVQRLLSGEKVLRITSTSRRDLCYRVALSGSPAKNAQDDETIYMRQK
ncbi:MAG: FHA domain-containing protein [Oscillospiraceae bacterium]|nr:FHA domain-containing protein [Oscillospiraceae bacterium]